MNEEQFSLKQIDAFLAVAESRSVTHAARVLHITQSGLSRVIHNLESALGESLFRRTPTGLVLTEFGSEFLHHARLLKQCYQESQQVALSRQAKPVVMAVCDLVLPAIIPLRIYDQLVIGQSSFHVLDQVASGEATVGLCMYGGGRDDLDCRPLLEAPIGLLSHPNMNLPTAITSLSELEDIPLASLAEDMLLPRLLQTHERNLHAAGNRGVVTNSMSTLLNIVQTGHFAALVSAVAASSEQAQKLQFVPLDHLLPKLSLCLIAPGHQSDHELPNSLTQRITTAVLAWPWLHCVQRAVHVT